MAAKKNHTTNILTAQAALDPLLSRKRSTQLSFTDRERTNFIVGCDGARRLASPFFFALRRGRPSYMEESLTTDEAAAAAVTGRACACDSP
eukprot:scaffold273674_cov31-Tisochrysis_lutea.AAC.1